MLCCSDEDESARVAGAIVGQWQLIHVHERSWDSHLSDESAKNIVYDFKANGILDVSGACALIEKGQYPYAVREETLTLGGQPYKTPVVTMAGRRWIYSFSDGHMTIVELDSDGGTLTFVRK